MNDLQEQLRRLDSIDSLLHHEETEKRIAAYGRTLVVDSLRRAIEITRQRILAGEPYPGTPVVLEWAWQILAAYIQPTLQPVINATGVILHTNLGRAPLSEATLEAMRRIGEGYSNLEYDLEAGHRGSRYVHAEALLCQLTGAEAALVVNNNAGAVLLALAALARDREVIISRGQLVEIGGGFRIPEVIAQSGAHLVEVGTTNRTYVSDYAAAIRAETAAILRVHSSNFRLIGFVHQPSLQELAELARAHNLLLLDDLGSGALLDTAAFGLAHEPMVQESISAGADLVTFSGDKLLGGPQAGMIVGKRALVERLRRFPLVRALRVDKTTLAGIQANLLHYIRGEALEHIPIWRMIAATADEIAARGRALLEALGPKAVGCEQVPGYSMIGGGSLPEETLPTILIALPRGDAETLAKRLRQGFPPVVARIQEDRVLLDLRTVLPREEKALLERLRAVL